LLRHTLADGLAQGPDGADITGAEDIRRQATIENYEIIHKTPRSRA
jgi:hypothetical protein